MGLLANETVPLWYEAVEYRPEPCEAIEIRWYTHAHEPPAELIREVVTVPAAPEHHHGH